MRTIRWRAALMVSLLGLVVCVLWLAGRALGTPPARSWGAASSWYELVGPSVALMAVVRVGALAVAVWLFVAATLELFAAVLPRPSIQRLAGLIAPRTVHRLMQGLAGLSLTAGLAVPAPGAATLDSPGAGVAVVRLVEEPPPEAGTATMHVVTDPTLPASAAATPPTHAVAVADAVSVETGDSLWSIAQGALVDAGDASPSDAAVTSYWRRVIEANLSVLVEPTNPDLIYPGQIITLPLL